MLFFLVKSRVPTAFFGTLLLGSLAHLPFLLLFFCELISGPDDDDKNT